MRFRHSAATIAVVLLIPPAGNAWAAGYGHSMQRSSSPAMRTHAGTSLQSRLFASPGLVQVGQVVTLSVVAPFPSTVRVSFHSLHHSFSGLARYQPMSRTYAVSVRLLVRAHGTEAAQVVAVVTPRATGRTYRLFSQFSIRGQVTAVGGIPQQNGGDADGDNNGAPSDRDGDR